MAPVQSRELFSYENLIHAIAGAAGSVTAMTAFYPLDTVRSVLQVDEKRKSKNSVTMIREIVKDDGFLSLYRGLFPVLASVCASNFVYFYTFHGLKALRSTADRNQSAGRDLLLATLAAAVNVVTTTPLWVVNMRLKLQGMKFHSQELKNEPGPQYNGLIDGLIKIGQTEGVGGLWSSTLPSMMLTINPGIQFMVYESLKRQLRKTTSSQDLSAWTYFLVGALSKAVATCLTYPLQIIQSKYRFGSHGKQNSSNQLGLMQMIMYILKTQGTKGLYKGLEAKLIQTVLTAALMLVCYEKIVAFVLRLLRASGGPARG